MRAIVDRQPNTKTQFTVDLSSKATTQALQNDGSTGNLVTARNTLRSRGADVDGPAEDTMASEPHVDADPLPGIPPSPQYPFPDFDKAERLTISEFEGVDYKHSGTRGQGGSASNPRSDREAISGRGGRSETCVVNAAFMGSNWPHKGGKKFHKPIVIDLDLPVVDGTCSV